MVNRAVAHNQILEAQQWREKILSKSVNN